MFYRLSCRNGHRWEPPPHRAAPGEEDLCPYCGELPHSPSQLTRQVWAVLGVLTALGLWALGTAAVAAPVGDVDAALQGLVYAVCLGAVAALAAGSHLRHGSRARRMEAAFRLG